MLEAEEKEIDGFTFRYQPMMAKKARALFDKLAQRFGPAIASAVEGLADADVDAEMNFAESIGGLTSSAGGLLRGVAGGMDPAFHAALADELAAKTQVMNDDGNFVPLSNDWREVAFGTKLLTEWRLIMWCLNVQYADFLAPLQSLAVTATGLRATALSRSDSRRASTGTPTESQPASATATA